MKVLIESMTKIQIHELTIRAWREDNDYKNRSDNYSTDVKELIIDVYNSLPDGKICFSELATELLKIERMNAIEVLDDNGDGCVVYKNWP